MPTTGGASSPSGSAGPPDYGDRETDPKTQPSGKGSIKVKRQASSKGLTKSKSTSSMKKKELKSSKSVERSDSAGAEVRHET
nr:hypothetical protein BaRGS_033209 [Batillaria attramentaria]